MVALCMAYLLWSIIWDKYQLGNFMGFFDDGSTIEG